MVKKQNFFIKYLDFILLAPLLLWIVIAFSIRNYNLGTIGYLILTLFFCAASSIIGLALMVYRASSKKEIRVIRWITIMIIVAFIIWSIISLNNQGNILSGAGFG
jgi:FtsH-binding integral membrane protein